jgi:hypothetical protein
MPLLKANTEDDLDFLYIIWDRPLVGEGIKRNMRAPNSQRHAPNYILGIHDYARSEMPCVTLANNNPSLAASS